jgi:hypothetical protein
MIGNRLGKGRVVACMTTAGSKWTDWPGGPAGPSYVVMMLALQKYLTALSDEAPLTVGSPLQLTLDAGRYERRMRRFYLAEARPDNEEPGQGGGREDLGEQEGAEDNETIELTFSEARRPGVYLFHLYPRAEDGVEPKPEERAFAFNVDTEAESDLKRAGREALEQTTVEAGRGKRVLEDAAAISGRPAERQSDWSESPWLYLIFLSVLVIEQAMAVHLSFHLRGSEAQTQTPAATAGTPAAAA